MLSHIRLRAQRPFRAAAGLAFPPVCIAACAVAFALAAACGPSRPAEHPTDGSASPVTSGSARTSAGPDGEPGPPATDDVEVPPAP